jgi:hypothetical protein
MLSEIRMSSDQKQRQQEIFFLLDLHRIKSDMLDLDQTLHSKRDLATKKAILVKLGEKRQELDCALVTAELYPHNVKLKPAIETLIAKSKRMEEIVSPSPDHDQDQEQDPEQRRSQEVRFLLDLHLIKADIDEFMETVKSNVNVTARLDALAKLRARQQDLEQALVTADLYPHNLELKPAISKILEHAKAVPIDVLLDLGCKIAEEKKETGELDESKCE